MKIRLGLLMISTLMIFACSSQQPYNNGRIDRTRRVLSSKEAQIPSEIVTAEFHYCRENLQKVCAKIHGVGHPTASRHDVFQRPVLVANAAIFTGDYIGMIQQVDVRGAARNIEAKFIPGSQGKQELFITNLFPETNIGNPY